jgi:hypothetical protein
MGVGGLPTAIVIGLVTVRRSAESVLIYTE